MTMCMAFLPPHGSGGSRFHAGSSAIHAGRFPRSACVRGWWLLGGESPRFRGAAPCRHGARGDEPVRLRAGRREPNSDSQRRSRVVLNHRRRFDAGNDFRKSTRFGCGHDGLGSLHPNRMSALRLPLVGRGVVAAGVAQSVRLRVCSLAHSARPAGRLLRESRGACGTKARRGEEPAAAGSQTLLVCSRTLRFMGCTGQSHGPRSRRDA